MERHVVLELQVSAQRTPARGECDPFFLALYLDANFEGRAVRMLVNPHHATAPVAVTVRGRCPALVAGHAHAAGALLPADAHLCLQGYTTTTNSEGVVCRQDCGAHVIPLRAAHRAAQTGASLSAPLRVHTTRTNLLKAQVDVRVTALRHVVYPARTAARAGAGAPVRVPHAGASATTPYDAQLYGADASATVAGALGAGAARALPVVFADLEPHMNAAENLPHLAAEMRRYAAAFVLENAQFEVVFPGTSDINCPFDPGEVTAENSQLAMPLAAFALVETPATSAAWWRREWQILAERRGLATGAALADWLETQPRAVRAGVAAEWCAQLPQLLPYVGDRTAGAPIEMFSDALAMLAGDCEDDAAAILQMRNALRTLPIGTLDHPVQRDLQHIASNYVDFLCIVGVTSAHAGGAASRDAVNNAHAVLHALPLAYVAHCVRNADPTHPLAQLAPPPGGARDVFVNMEGTGVLDGGVERDPCPAARRHLFGQRVLAPLKKALHGEPGAESSFYKVVLVGTTARFLTSCRTATVRFCKRNPVSGRFSRGVRFVDLARLDPDICIVPYGSSAAAQVALRSGPDGLTEDARAHFAALATAAGDAVADAAAPRAELTVEQLRIMRAVVKTRIPPPPMLVDAGAAPPPPDAAVALAKLRRCCARINAALDSAADAASPVAPAATAPVHVFPYVQQVDASFVRALERAFATPDSRYIAGAACHLEAHHPCLHVLRLTFFCHRERQT
jgi:hypothetical protein